MAKIYIYIKIDVISNVSAKHTILLDKYYTSVWRWWLFHISVCLFVCVFGNCCNSCHIIIPKKWIYWNLFWFVLNVHPSLVLTLVFVSICLCACVCVYFIILVRIKSINLPTLSAITSLSHANNLDRTILSVCVCCVDFGAVTVWHVRIKSAAATTATVAAAVVVAIWSGLHANC